MTLFPTKPDSNAKSPPKRHRYSPGFIKVYEAFGKYANKAEAFKEWQKQGLERYADFIAEKATCYFTYCKVKERFQMHLRRWLHNQGWEDELFEDKLTFNTPEQAYQAFKANKWTHCDDIDCRNLTVKRNSDVLILGSIRIFPKNQIRNLSFMLRFDGKVNP